MNFSSISQVKHEKKFTFYLTYFKILSFVNNMNKKDDIRIPKQERSIETKNSIIGAGLKLFSEKGYYKTNSKEIAREADVSIGSFYTYFSDKKDLFREVLIDYHRKIKKVLENIEVKEFVQAGDIKGFLRYLVDKLIEAHGIYPEFHQEIIAMSQSDPDIIKISENSKRESIDLTKAILVIWKYELRIKDIDAAAVIIQAAIEEIVHTIVYSDYSISDERIINELTEMLFRYLF